MELKVHVHNDDTDAEVIVDLMDLDGGGEEHSVFDYDDKDYPCPGLLIHPESGSIHLINPDGLLILINAILPIQGIQNVDLIQFTIYIYEK